MNSDFIVSAPQFVVADVVRTAEYYRDILGFAILDYFLDPPGYAMVQRNGVEIHFGKPDADDVQRSNVALRQAGFDIYIWVDDVDRLFDEFTKSKAKIVTEPVDRSYGNREMSVLDCNGFKLTFGSSIKA